MTSPFDQPAPAVSVPQDEPSPFDQLESVQAGPHPDADPNVLQGFYPTEPEVDVGPFRIVREEFSSFEGPGIGDGMTIKAYMTDDRGHDTEYSVSLINGKDQNEQMVVDQYPETDVSLQRRLHTAAEAEINNPSRALLIASRFGKNADKEAPNA